MSTILTIPPEVLSKILEEVSKNRSPTYEPVLKTPDDFEAIERTIGDVLACRLVNKQFKGIATRFCSPQFIDLLPKLQALTKGVRFSKKKEINSSSVGLAVSDMADFLFVRRLRHSIPFVIDKIFTKPEDRAKAKAIFAGFTFLVGTPETLIASRVANDPKKLIFLDTFINYSHQCHQFVGGAITFEEPVGDIAELLRKKRQDIRKHYKSLSKYCGVLVRQETTTAAFRLHRPAINNLVADLGCAEWSLKSAEEEKEFLFPRFLLAINGLTNVAINPQTISISIITSELQKFPNVPFILNKISFKENEVIPFLVNKKADYPSLGTFEQIKQRVLDFNPKFHSYEEVEQFYKLLRSYTNAWILGNLRIGLLSEHEGYYSDAESKGMKKKVKKALPILEMLKNDSSFVASMEASLDIPFNLSIVATYSFKLAFSESLQLKVTMQILSSSQGAQMINVYVNGIGWKPMDKIMKEKNLERLMIAYSTPNKPEHRKYPTLKFRHNEVVDLINSTLNQHIQSENFSLEWLLRKLFIDITDVQMQEEVASLYSLEVYYMREAFKDTSDIDDSASGSDSEEDEVDPDDLILSSSDSYAEHYGTDSDSDLSSDSYKEGPEDNSD